MGGSDVIYKTITEKCLKLPGMTLLILESAGLYWNMRTVMRRVMYCRIHTGIPHTFYSPTGNQPFLPFRIGVNF